MAMKEVAMWSLKKARLSQDHPPGSALNLFDEIANASKGKQVVMFLDYDGTLSPIVNDPDRAYMSDEMRTTIRKLAECLPTAIVTGRCLEKVRNFVNLDELYYAGSHGMDIKGPSKGVVYQPAEDYLPMIDKVYWLLVEKTKSTAGANVENNKFCLSVHFRRVDEENWKELAGEVGSVLDDYSKLRVTPGRKVLEIRPTINWDKGKALVFLLESLGYTNCDDVCPVYIGDDRTDEDAFKLKKNSVALDVVNISEEESKTEKLEAFVAAVNNNDRSHFVHVNVPAGSNALYDVLLRNNNSVMNNHKKEDTLWDTCMNNHGMHIQKSVEFDLFNQSRLEHAIAYVEGAEATMNVWDLFIQQTNEFSSSQVWLSGGSSFASVLNSWLGIELRLYLFFEINVMCFKLFRCFVIDINQYV
ncbi:hypothetical protein L1987_38617 [Smallanthus sonchifolius]|uniref:Uncharacterized protein n=1 Tax=Smallanthus sonchifolius TaxID=185202 RepID=A0ACB9HL16_9ASTR|nr:hypothetical protein L1987_38617 [Smallanthus sonchifolius]